MGSLLPRPALDPSGLDPENYLVSLIDEAWHKELLSDAGLAVLQLRTLDLVKDQVRKYTSGQSSSVPVEIAEKIMASALFCVDTSLLAETSPEKSLEKLLSKPLPEIYSQGLAQLRGCLQETRRLYQQTRSNRVELPLLAYNYTLDVAIPDFLSHYDPDYAAHEIPASIDYQLACQVTGKGVFYIQAYLERLFLENRFCALFPVHDLQILLENYGRVYRIDYPEYLLNIFEIVLANSLFSSALGYDRRNLTIHIDQIRRVSRQLLPLASSEIAAVLELALQRLCDELELDPPMIAYLNLCQPDMVSRFIDSIRQETLDKLVIPVVLPQASTQVSVDPGSRMDDDAFRTLAGNLLALDDPRQKAAAILTQVSSLTDFVDILKADCLYGEDFICLYEMMGDLELAVLVGLAYPGELRNSPDDFWLAIAQASPDNDEDEWLAGLRIYIESMDLQRRLILKRLLELDWSSRI